MHRVLTAIILLTMIDLPFCSNGVNKVQLSGPVVIGTEWVEFQPKPPLKANDRQMILLDLEEPFKYDFYEEGVGPNKGSGILVPSGEIANPVIEVFDETGTSFTFVWSGARERFSPVYSLPHPQELPKGKLYSRVRMRSETPIKCKAIYWYTDVSTSK